MARKSPIKPKWHRHALKERKASLPALPAPVGLAAVLRLAAMLARTTSLTVSPSASLATITPATTVSRR